MDVAELLIALLLARVLAAAFEKVGIASFTAYVICGYVLGPQLLNVVNEVSEQLLGLSMITLFFYVGMSIDLRVVKLTLKDSIRLSLTGILATSLPVFTLLTAIGRGVVPALIVAIALSNTATEVVVLTLNSLGIRGRVRDMIITSSFFDDLVVVGSIPFIESLTHGYTEVFTYILKLSSLTILVVLVGLALSRGFRDRVVGPKTVVNLAVTTLLAFTYLGHIAGMGLAFSAYLAGLSIGFLRLVRDPTLVRVLRLDDLIRYLSEVLDLVLIPIFFLYVGFVLDATTVSTVEFVLILTVAFSGKFIGCALAAPSKRLLERATYGIVMNARGALEPTVALLALNYGLITVNTYSTVILVSTVTSVTVPVLLRLLYSVKSGRLR